MRHLEELRLESAPIADVIEEYGDEVAECPLWPCSGCDYIGTCTK